MKWALAGSQMLLLCVLVFRGSWRFIPGFSVYLAFAIFSSIVYDPYHQAAFGWLSMPSSALRGIACVECVWILTTGELLRSRSLLCVAAGFGCLLALSASWGVGFGYSGMVTASIYLTIGLAGALWTVLGLLWRRDALPMDWRRSYALGLGVYFGVMACARLSSPAWLQAQNLSMLSYLGVFCWLSKEFLKCPSYRWADVDESEGRQSEGEAPQAGVEVITHPIAQ